MRLFTTIFTFILFGVVMACILLGPPVTPSFAYSNYTAEIKREVIEPCWFPIVRNLRRGNPEVFRNMSDSEFIAYAKLINPDLARNEEETKSAILPLVQGQNHKRRFKIYALMKEECLRGAGLQ